MWSGDCRVCTLKLSTHAYHLRVETSMRHDTHFGAALSRSSVQFEGHGQPPCSKFGKGQSESNGAFRRFDVEPAQLL